MSRASSDILLQVDADVILPPASLFHILRCLTEPPRPVVAIGAAGPDPLVRGLGHRAAAWQLNATRRYASWLADGAVRAEAACWGAWRSFYDDYRFPVGTDSAVDDVILARHLSDQNVDVMNCWRAVVYKVPAGTLSDSFLQTHRGYAVSGARMRSLREVGAAALEAARDPLGASLYVHARIWSAREQRRRRPQWSEEWAVTRSTKRK
jgi:hypothetical protein